MKGQFIAKLRSAKKTPKVTSVSEKIHILQGNGFVWKDLQNPDRSKLEELQKEHGLNALNVEDCLTKFELPKLDSYNDHVFFILHFPPIGSKEIYKHSQLSVFAGNEISLFQDQLQAKPRSFHKGYQLTWWALSR